MLKKLLLKKKQEGFTIVEVMIVLAIAGLIILVVFLAVPALQRNSRNTQRNNDASLIGSAVNECLNNRNGQSTSCDETTEISQYLDTSKLRQLTTVAASTAMPTNTTTAANIAFGRKCNADGSAATTTGANSRSVALLYNTENTSGGAVNRCQEI